MNVAEIVFSPTGGTEKVADIIGKRWSENLDIFLELLLFLIVPLGHFHKTLVRQLTRYIVLRELLSRGEL